MSRVGHIDLSGVRGFAADRPTAAIWSARAAKARRIRHYALILLGAALYVGAIVGAFALLVGPGA